jgi:hypothetical protein
MSLADARLDRIGDGFLLLGADKDVVRWVSIDGQRNAGKEQSAAVPAARKLGPWFAAAGRNTPGDTILIVYGTVAANGTDLDLMVVAAVADGSAAPGPAVAVTTIVGGAKIGAAPQIALGTSQSGMRAGLAWTAPGSDALTALMLGGDAQGVGASFPVDTATARVGCVGFVPGKDDLSLAYYRYQSDSDTQPVWVIAETHESGMITSTLALDLLDQSPSCPLLVSTSGGYALAWQNAAGSTLGTYVFVGNSFAAHLFAGAVEFGGPTLQPPLAGLGLAGNDFAVVVARVGAGQVWRVSAEGARVSGALVFPSESGNLGTISSVPVTGALFSTYADYPAGATTSASSGQRYLVETTCL